jgi:hypothetical protein
MTGIAISESPMEWYLTVSAFPGQCASAKTMLGVKTDSVKEKITWREVIGVHLSRYG